MPERKTHVVDVPVNKENTKLNPLVIRGHHLYQYTLLIMGDDPSILAGVIVPPEEATNPKLAKYGKDVLGTTADQATNFEETSKLAFESFLNSPDNRAVEIVEGIPDDICKGCAIGNHCRSLFNKDYHDHELTTFERDKKFVDLFLKRLGKLNLPRPILTEDQANFSDAPPQTVRRLTTTIGIAKEVLGEGHLLHFFHWQNKSFK